MNNILKAVEDVKRLQSLALAIEPKPQTTNRGRAELRADRLRVIRNRKPWAVDETAYGRFAKISPLANKISKNPRAIYKGMLALTACERRALDVFREGMAELSQPSNTEVSIAA